MIRRSPVPPAVAACLGVLATLLAGAVAQAAPVLRLPGAGRVVATSDTPVRDGFDQRIQFGGGAGTNAANLGLRTQTADLVLAFPANLARPNRAGIDAEIAALFPGQVLRVLAVPRRNAYGPVGMAVGADCLYAWQWIDLTPAMMGGSGGRPRLFGSLSRPDPVGAVSLRIRLCRTERASLPDLIAAVEGLSLDLAARPRLDVPAPIVRTRRPAPRPAAVAAPRRKAPATATERVAAQPDSAAPPESAGRRFLAPPASNTVAPPSPAPPVARPAVAPPAGARYITDVIRPPETPDRAVSTPSPSPAGRPSSPEGVSPDLPIQAIEPAPRNRR